MAETAVVRKAELLPAPLLGLVKSLVPDCGALLPQDITTEQFRAGLWLELTGRPQLNGCSLDSLRACIVQAAQDGMLPGRDTHFLPFRVKGQLRATKVDNYHGLQRALERTGKVIRSWAAPVCEGDTWEFDRFMDRPKHVEAMTLGKVAGRELFYYGAVLFKDHTCAFEPISMEELKAIELSAPSHDTGPWKEWPQMMRRKSALKRVCKYVPVTAEMQRILDADDERLQTDIPPERHRKNITDLFDNNESASTPGASGDVVDVESHEDSASAETSVGIPRPAGDRALSYVAQIEALLVTEGSPIPAFWRWATVQKKKAQAQFSEADYTDLLTRVKSQAIKRKEENASTAQSQDAQKTNETRSNFGPDEKADPSHTETNLGSPRGLPAEYVTIDSYTGEVLDPHDSAALDHEIAAQERQPGEEG